MPIARRCCVVVVCACVRVYACVCVCVYFDSIASDNVHATVVVQTIGNIRPLADLMRKGAPDDVVDVLAIYVARMLYRRRRRKHTTRRLARLRDAPAAAAAAQAEDHATDRNRLASYCLACARGVCSQRAHGLHAGLCEPRMFARRARRAFMQIFRKTYYAFYTIGQQ